jgi:hypothetical protein
VIGGEENWDTPANRENAIAPTGDKLPALDDDPDWLALARTAYDSSSTFVNANLRDQWERNYKNFQSVHPSGSKYWSDAFKHRARIFRPKTRSAVRKNEAAVAQAFFSTTEAVNISAENDDDEKQQASAAFYNELLNYRLKKTIPWFLLCLGANQDAQITGVCISKQYWEFREEKTGSEMVADSGENGDEPIIDETGAVNMIEKDIMKPIVDRPWVSLIPPENIRIDPSAEWTDPIGTSPYLIQMIPMYVGDVRAKMEEKDSKTGRPKWRKYDDAVILQAQRKTYDNVREARENNRLDSAEMESPIRKHDIVWVHENFIRWNDKDYQFYTLGTRAMLTEPKPAEEVYPHAPRPYVMGYATLEAHKTYPTSKVELTEQLQHEVNEITNQRLDNVKLALNGRYFVRQGKNVDLDALRRSVPGGAVLMENPETDVVWNKPADVTASSYQEQDRLNIEFDDLAGNFSPASVATNRKLNETVGGMNLLSSSASGMTEYDMRIFSETWVEPVLRQLVKLEQMYETDPAIMSLAASKAQLVQKFGIDKMTDDLLEQELTINVNVGIGATNPRDQLNNFLFGVNALGQIFENPMSQELDKEELISEVMGKCGYRDGMRFMKKGSDPQSMQLQQQLQQAQQQLQQLQQQIDSKQAENQSRVQVAQITAQGKMAETQAVNENEVRVTAMEGQVRLVAEQMKAQVQQQNIMLQAIADLSIELKKAATLSSEKEKDRAAQRQASSNSQ